MRARRSLIAVVVAFVTVRRIFRWRGRCRAGDIEREVRYRVPIGQDPAAALGTLRVAGMTARPEIVQGESVLVISLSPSVSRERVREVLRDAAENLEGDTRISETVTFTDEV